MWACDEIQARACPCIARQEPVHSLAILTHLMAVYKGVDGAQEKLRDRHVARETRDVA